MIPRIQFRFMDGQAEGPVPNHVFRETCCNPESFCSPVCCCCGLVSVQAAVKGVFLVALFFSTWEITMGGWLLVASYHDVQMDPVSNSTDLSMKQLHRLVAASWLIIGAGLFRLLGVAYLLYVVYNEDRRRKLPAIFCISLSSFTGLLLMYPFSLQIPGKGLLLNEGSNLKYFTPIYVTGQSTDLLIMLIYSLYCVLYYAMVNSHERHWGLQRARFDNIDTEVNLM